MSGTKAGAAKTAKTNIEKYGKDFYKNIGAKGGKASTTGGFGSDKVGADGLTGKQRARIAGAKGGRTSTRLGVKNGEGKKAKEQEKTLDYIEEDK